VGRPTGIEVVEVVRDSPADRAGLRPEDLIVAVDSHGVERVDDLQRLMVGERIGQSVTLRVLRADRVLELSIVPTELQIRA
jgi:S1-C subfamily serine protease